MQAPRQTVTVQAVGSLEPSASVVENAERVGALVVEQLGQGHAILVSLHGLRGVPSSWFNVLFDLVTGAHGVEGLSTRVTFDRETETQRRMLDRSLQAALAPTSRDGRRPLVVRQATSTATRSAAPGSWSRRLRCLRRGLVVLAARCRISD